MIADDRVKIFCEACQKTIGDTKNYDYLTLSWRRCSRGDRREVSSGVRCTECLEKFIEKMEDGDYD